MDGARLSYKELREQISNIQKNAVRYGIAKNSTVALSLPNSPETALLMLAFLSYCRVAPLNPAYTAHECHFALIDLEAMALVAAPEQRDAVTAARQANIGVVKPSELLSPAAGAGDRQPEDSAVEPADIALLLHTSGTTSKPKLVPLKHRSLFLSATAVAEVLRLEPQDRCLSIMPLFHIHGIVAGLLASVAAGAATICAPGFQTAGFFGWLDRSEATWYTGVPTMHQAILLRARHNRGVIARHKLRLIRSSSAPLFPSVWKELESVFCVPVVNSYGMTEASHQIASTRLGALGQERSSVGASSGPQIAILDADGSFASPGVCGEVVLRGEQIIDAYRSPPECNQTSFKDGWFRTGDQGRMNESGELTLTGRLKEIINSGGEKICPYEVEEALLLHPAVVQAVVFAAPHPLLGEQVTAAVVLSEGQTLRERDLLESLRSRLAHCKVPRRVLFVDEIPRGPSGKLQRIGLAERLGLHRDTSAAALTQRA